LIVSENTGLFTSVRQLFATLTGIAATRLALLVNEWQEERLRLTQVLLFALLAAISFGIACVLLVIFVAVLFWDEHRLAALGVMTGVFFLVGGLFVLRLNAKLRSGSKLVSARLAELEHDRSQLRRSHD
jgi:uncharacterized membrane protein YqjE